MKILKSWFDLFSICFLTLLCPLFVFPRDKWNWALLVGVGAVMFGRWFMTREFLPRTPIDEATALLAVWAFFGIMAKGNLALATSKVAGLSFGIVYCYLLIGVLSSIPRIKIAIAILISMGLAIAVIGTLSRLDGLSVPQIDKNTTVKSIPKVIIKLDRAETGINPNPLGGTLLLFFPPGIMVFAKIIKNKKSLLKKPGRYPAIISLAIILGLEAFAVIYSRSLGALAAFGIVLLMIRRKGRILRSTLGMAILFALSFILKSSYMNQSELIKNTRISINESAAVRIPFWKGGLQAVYAHPFFGLGMDRLRITPPFKYIDAHAHNQFIHLAAEMGVPALIAYLAILIGAGWMTLAVVRSAMPEWMIMIMRGLAWGQVGFAVFGIADAIPLGSKPGIFFWYSLALMTSIYLYGRENRLLNEATPPKAIG